MSLPFPSFASPPAAGSERPESLVELGELGRKLQLELRRVDPFRLRDEEAPTQELELQAQLFVRRTESIPLCGDLRERPFE